MVESQCLLEPEKVGPAGGMLPVSCDLALHMGYGIMSRQRPLGLCTTHVEDIFCSMICEYVIVDSLPLSKSWTWLLSAFSAPPFLPSIELAIKSTRATTDGVMATVQSRSKSELELQRWEELEGHGTHLIGLVGSPGCKLIG